jgi:hypothetical protein
VLGCAILRAEKLEQIQFLGHVSIQTTERYLGCKQRIRAAVNDRTASNPKAEVPAQRPCSADDPPGGDGKRDTVRQEPFLLNRLARPEKHFYDKAVNEHRGPSRDCPCQRRGHVQNLNDRRIFAQQST